MGVVSAFCDAVIGCRKLSWNRRRKSLKSADSYKGRIGRREATVSSRIERRKRLVSRRRGLQRAAPVYVPPPLLRNLSRKFEHEQEQSPLQFPTHADEKEHISTQKTTENIDVARSSLDPAAEKFFESGAEENQDASRPSSGSDGLSTDAKDCIRPADGYREWGEDSNVFLNADEYEQLECRLNSLAEGFPQIPNPPRDVQKWPEGTEARLSRLLSSYEIPDLSDTLVDLRPGRRIIAIGDIHGDLSLLRDLLTTARVMDRNSTIDDPVWVGGDDICVFCGDALDRGSEELACLRALAFLARQARRGGGSLYMLLGNHEVKNSAGRFRDATEGGMNDFDQEFGDFTTDSQREVARVLFCKRRRGAAARWVAMAPGGLLAEPLLTKMKIAVVIGKTCFVHGGLTAEHITRYGGIKGMNTAAAVWMSKAPKLELDSQGRPKMPDLLRGEESPLWMRAYSTVNKRTPASKQAEAEEKLVGALEAVGGTVERMVMGHTAQTRISGRFGGKAWCVDVSQRKTPSGETIEPEVLEIIHNGVGVEDTVRVLTLSGRTVSSGKRLVRPSPS